MSKKKEQIRSRLSFEERRAAILASVIPLFESQGFKGVTTRVLADAAGVSEALLYQHFASKEILYAEVQDRLCRRIPSIEHAIESAKPSTEAIILFTYLFASMTILPPPEVQIDPMFSRLMIQSLLEDGEFARLHFERCLKGMSQIIADSIAEARRVGDIAYQNIRPTDDQEDLLSFTFMMHLFVMIYLNLVAEKVHPHYPKDRESLLELALLFALRGIGLTEEALKKYYQPDQLKKTVSHLLKSETKLSSLEVRGEYEI